MTRPHKPLTFVSYAAGQEATAYAAHRAVGDELPSVPLFLTSEHYLNVPLKPSYDAAFRGMPHFWRNVIEGRQSPPSQE